MSRNAASTPSQNSGPKGHHQQRSMNRWHAVLPWMHIDPQFRGTDSPSSKTKETNLDQVFGSSLEAPFEYLGLELVLRARCGPQCANNELMDPWTSAYAHTVQHTQDFELKAVHLPEQNPVRIETSHHD